MPFKSSARGAYGPQGQKVIKGPLAPVWVTSGALSNGNIGSSYSVQLSATDDSGDAPTYTIASGSLPPGLSLSSSGLISGTISGSASTFTFTVNATDINGRATTSSSLSIATISPALYSFTTATFTTNGQVGQTGSDVSQGRASIGNPSWANTYLTNGSYTGWWNWTVPSTGSYRFIVAGSRGQSSNQAGGNGAVIQGSISLTENEVLQLSIGKYYNSSTNNTGVNGGGGGASFVYRNNTAAPIFVAGGGGGGGGTWVSTQYGGAPGRTTNTGEAQAPNTPWTSSDDPSNSIGQGGYSGTGGGLSYNGTGGGGGWFGDGQDGNNTSQGGRRLNTGGIGGAATDPNSSTNNGGYGGGGGARNVCGAGGGGYTGGNAAAWDGSATGGGGGGGSYTGTGVTFESGTATNSGQGYITITKL